MTDYSILTQKPDDVETIKVQCAHIFFNGVGHDTSNFPREVYPGLFTKLAKIARNFCQGWKIVANFRLSKSCTFCIVRPQNV